MRLSQLARKLEISPSELILFFEKNKIKTYNSHNNKIEENDLKLALNHFGTVEMEAENRDQVLQAPDSTMYIPNPSPGSDSNILGKESADAEPPLEEEEEIEVISMPKIKLEGVKVIGKIELPEPLGKVKDENNPGTEEQKLSDNISDDGLIKEDQKIIKRSFRHKNKHQRTRRELSYEEKLKREERKKILAQQRAKKLKKEQKKMHYIKNVQSNVAPTRIKKKRRKTDQSDLKPVKVRPVYKNPIRKFWAWLNGEYDQ